MNLIFEISEKGKRCATIRTPDVKAAKINKKYHSIVLTLEYYDRFP